MSEFKHTPGPWKVLPEEVDRDYIRVRGTMLGGRYKVANVLTPVHVGVAQREADETRANARLIAAAPDLLEALERMAGAFVPHPRDDTEGWREEHEACELARAAIAKATGAGHE